SCTFVVEALQVVKLSEGKLLKIDCCNLES
ncbi:MAG: hypothetical protein V7638_660, partial [Acidobacteriota bacterium]